MRGHVKVKGEIMFFPSPESVDMFSDELPAPSSEGAGSKGGPAPSDEVMWEYRWENKDGEKVHGPFTSTQMLEWVTSG